MLRNPQEMQQSIQSFSMSAYQLRAYFEFQLLDFFFLTQSTVAESKYRIHRSQQDSGH